MKKLFISLCAALVALLCVAALSACADEHEHVYKIESVKAATCTSKGEEVFVCDVCGEKYANILPVKEHNVVVDEAQNATCYQIGKTEGKHCADCGKIIVKQTVSDILPHRYDSTDKCIYCGKLLPSYCTHGLEFKFVNSVYAVSAYNGEDSKVIIPSQYVGTEVKYIADGAFKNNGKVTEIIIPQGVTEIGDEAFEGCANLERVDIPEGVVKIGKGAFAYCNSLKTLSLPDSLESANDAFRFNNSLTEITIGASNKNFSSVDGNLYDANGQTLLKYASGKNSDEFSIPDKVVNISDYAFFGSRHLKKIIIPNGVKYIGESAFAQCGGLKELTLAETVTYIGDGAFKACASIENVYIPSATEYIGTGAFLHCDSLKKISVSANNESYKSSDGNLYTKDGKTLIRYAVGKTDKIFAVPDGVENIGDEAFAYCFNIEEAFIPDCVITLSERAFYSCAALSEVKIGKGLKYIGDSAFSACAALESVSLPDNVESIGAMAFSGSAIISVRIGGGVKNIGHYAFSACSRLSDIDVSEDNAYFKSTDGNLYSKDGKIFIQYALGKTDKIFYIPDSVEIIRNYAFAQSSLCGVSIGENVREIGYGAFADCKNLTAARFTVKNGWSAAEKALSAELLSDEIKAAECLTGTYSEYYWKRKS